MTKRDQTCSISRHANSIDSEDTLLRYWIDGLACGNTKMPKVTISICHNFEFLNSPSKADFFFKALLRGTLASGVLVLNGIPPPSLKGTAPSSSARSCLNIEFNSFFCRIGFVKISGCVPSGRQKCISSRETRSQRVHIFKH